MLTTDNATYSHAGGRALVAIALVLCATAGFQEGERDPEELRRMIEQARKGPELRLDQAPDIKIDTSAFHASPDETRQIQSLVESLAEIKADERVHPSWISGRDRINVGSGQLGFFAFDNGTQVPDAVRRLVAFGPKALPALLDALDALDDVTETGIVKGHSGGFGSQWYSMEIQTNSAQKRERRAIAGHSEVAQPGFGLGAGLDSHVPRHVITRGDICFVIIGQITNRNYQAARYQPTGCMVINSPTATADIAAIVRTAWQSDDAARALFDSLMTDLHTRGRGSSDFQCGAAQRLLYYFPEQTADLISRRIERFDVKRVAFPAPDYMEAWTRRFEENGVRVAGFIKSVSWTSEPRVRRAVLGVLERTDDPSILRECLNEPIVSGRPEQALRRIRAVLEVPPPAQQGPFGSEYQTLREAVAMYPDRARSLVELYARHGTLACQRAAIHSLRRPAQPVSWAVEYLAPLLEDKTPTGWEYGPDYDRKGIRVCDEAAQTLVEHLPGIRFELEGTHDDLDRQIARIKRFLQGDESASFQPPPEPVSPADVDRREPDAVLEFDESFSGVYPFSDTRTIFVGHGYQSENGWAYETVWIDVERETIVMRAPLDEWCGGVSTIRPARGETALCYHGDSGGHIIERDVRTGVELKRIETPFHDGVSFGDPLQVRNLGDMARSGDGNWTIAFTADGVLHSINVATGKHTQEWKFEGEIKFPKIGVRGTLTAVEGRNQFLLSLFAATDTDLLWDQDSGKMTELLKVPSGGWRAAWGPLAWNHMNNRATVWNLETRTRVKLPIPEEQIAQILCDDDQSTLFARRTDGPIEVINMNDGRIMCRLMPPESRPRTDISLSSDSRMLFWLAGDYHAQGGSRSSVIAVFDVEDLTR